MKQRIELVNWNTGRKNTQDNKMKKDLKKMR